MAKNILSQVFCGQSNQGVEAVSFPFYTGFMGAQFCEKSFERLQTLVETFRWEAKVCKLVPRLATGKSCDK